ncbi:flagellar motor protein MotB [Bacillus sp. 03113]|uniref:flagellar motor protein MotB n=1 Tax=Bacillus sp. 03113 TaxID=2578211 RepID=UPI00114323D0|nr:flagellar motor protein MotB [Bacillus sp. 03113]
MSRRKKKHDEEHIDESWLIPYADLLTLLLALFIVLYAISSVDAKKFQALSRALNEEFQGGTSIFDFPSPMSEREMENLDKKSIEVKTSENAEEDQKKLAEELRKKLDQEELAAIQQKVNTYIMEKQLSDRLETSLSGEGLLVSIRDNVLFHSGSATILPEDYKIVGEISDLLVMDPPRNIIISGHTDNVPIQNSNFGSNWELSVMRSINFMKILLQNKQLDPQMFSAKGFGEFQPVASNETVEGKARNRRVEILITPRSSSQNQ